VLDALAEKNQLWARNAPVLIVTACVPDFSQGGQPNRWCEYDAGQAAMSLCLQAASLGLATHQMGGFDVEAVRKATAIPADWHVMSVIALGHPAPPEAAPEEFREMEEAPRARKPIEDIAAAGRWGAPWSPPPACGWEARYRETDVESLPWFHPALDPDIEWALDELGLNSGRLLDVGCGPGTQAAALARRGFDVTATDVAPAAVAAARRCAEASGAAIRFAVDNVLDSGLDGPFDVIVDRGVFHCFERDEDRAAWHRTMKRLLAPDGVLLLKCFHKRETRPEGPPERFDEEDIRRMLPDFTVVRCRETCFPSSAIQPAPKALFCILKRRNP